MAGNAQDHQVKRPLRRVQPAVQQRWPGDTGIMSGIVIECIRKDCTVGHAGDRPVGLGQPKRERTELVVYHQHAGAVRQPVTGFCQQQLVRRIPGPQARLGAGAAELQVTGSQRQYFSGWHD